MYLERVSQPSDLADLTYEQLDELAGEIRDFIVAAVSDNAGHLGSNLGAVELTLALHRVFASPTDAILWDTGHQAYVHKIVTGRQAQFQQLRRVVGLPQPRGVGARLRGEQPCLHRVVLRLRDGGGP